MGDRHISTHHIALRANKRVVLGGSPFWRVLPVCAERVEEERLGKGEAWHDMGLVFANEIGRPLEAGNVLRRSFWPLLKRAELPHMRFHDLRHTAATLLLERASIPRSSRNCSGTPTSLSRSDSIAT